LRKRIYLNFIGLIIICSLLLTIAISAVVYQRMIDQQKEAIRDKAILIADLLNEGINITDDYFTNYYTRSQGIARLTIIASDGTVLLDNKIDALTMDSHADRIEFTQAVLNGTYNTIRYSETLGATAYYYAIRLDNGNVLRVSQTMYNISGVASAILITLIVIMMIVLIPVNIAARRLTENIIKPINDISLDSNNKRDTTDVLPPYDELIPYARKIEQQKLKINEQLSMLKHRADTIEAITSNMKEGLILLDEAGTVLIANHCASEVLNDTNMTGKQITHICRDIEFGKSVKLCLSGTSSIAELIRGFKKYNVYFSPVFTSNDFGGAVILFLDITVFGE